MYISTSCKSRGNVGLTSMFAGIAYVTILGSVSVSMIPIVGTFMLVHSLIRPRFSDGLRITTRSGMLDFCWIGRGPKLRMEG